MKDKSRAHVYVHLAVNFSFEMAAKPDLFERPFKVNRRCEYEGEHEYQMGASITHKIMMVFPP